MNKKWTPEEDNFLKEYYPTHDNEELAIALDRPVGGIGSRAVRLGLRKAPKGEIVNGMKTCSMCHRTLEVTEHFHKSKTEKGGYASACKYCNSPQQKKARQIQREKERTSKQQYICTRCGAVKMGWEFKWSTKKNRRENECQTCASERDRKNKINRIKDGRDW